MLPPLPFKKGIDREQYTKEPNMFLSFVGSVVSFGFKEGVGVQEKRKEGRVKKRRNNGLTTG